MPKMLSYDQFTILAPTDAAFKKLPNGTLDKLASNPDVLAELVYLHFLPGGLRTYDSLLKLAPLVQVGCRRSQERGA